MPYTPEALTDLLRSALKALDDAAVPEDLRETAFEKAFDALAGTASPSASASTGGDAAGSGAAPAPPRPADASTPIGKIAAALSVDEESASHVFDISGDELTLTVTRAQLADDRAEAVREIALLVVAGRQAAGLDEERTHTNRARHEAEQLNVMAKNTFQAEMAKLTPLVTVKNVAMGRELKITRHGNTEAGKIVKRITGGGT